MDDLRLYLTGCGECNLTGKLMGGATCYACNGQRVLIVGEDDDPDIVIDIELATEDEVN